jgi:hypothetical protein
MEKQAGGQEEMRRTLNGRRAQGELQRSMRVQWKRSA